MPSDTLTSNGSGAHWSLYVLLGALTGAVLVYGVSEQIFDTNFYVLWEATALLAGDHPYRDFYQWGSPLLTAFTTLVQWLVGYRLIGEFVIHWVFIVAGVLMGFHLGLRLSRSVSASVTTTLVAILIVASTPTFNFPKLFFYPVAVWVTWWYMERPGVRRAAMVGLVTAVAFLYRHDHGVYIGLASVLAFALARVAVPASRNWRSAAREAAAYAVVASLVVAPWAIVVQMNEGMVDYVRTRGEWAQKWAAGEFPYLALRNFNPLHVLTASDSWFPSRDHAQHWLLQITLLLPILLLVSTAVDARTRWRRREAVPIETCRVILAAGLVVIVADRLFREDGYFVVVLPLTAAFGAQLLAAPAWTGRTWRITQRTLAFGALLITIIAAVGYVDRELFEPSQVEELSPSFRQLIASPPIDGYQPADEARQLDRTAWLAPGDLNDKLRIMIRYVHDCTRDGDRVFVTGSTPYQVGYYVERPIAGGHVQWHHGWRSDPVHEMQSLMLIESQSVPFAFSTTDPILDDLKAYPRIREYMKGHYIEIEGSEGRLLVDTRRRPTGRFGAVGFPCFR